MPRSNKAARAKSRRLDRRPPGERRVIPKGVPPRTDLADLVMPDGRCMRNPRRPKDIFYSVEKAQKALEQAQRARIRMGSGHMEKRFYLCKESEGGCGGHHLTSRESYDPAWKRGKA